MSAPLRVLIVGSGWRSLFFVRVIKALPERFTLCAMLCRTAEKAARMAKEHGIPTSTDPDACAAMKPDFAVIAVDKRSNAAVTREWMARGVPLLCETPAAETEEQLRELWALSCGGARMQVAEQYFLYPGYTRLLRALETGLIGRPTELTISVAHDYHAVSLMRRILNVGFENAVITGETYPSLVTVTGARGGPVRDGHTVTMSRARCAFRFDGGALAFYDFIDAQYHSDIRRNYLNVRGPRGEVVNDELDYLATDDNRPLTMSLAHPAREVALPDALTDDEFAVARHMLSMRAFLDSGTELYPLADAMQDAYFSACMHRARETGEAVQTATQPWAK